MPWMKEPRFKVNLPTQKYVHNLASPTAEKKTDENLKALDMQQSCILGLP